jgi:hypothetical protein
MRSLFAASCVLFSATLLSGCDESDAVSMRLNVKNDFSGTFTTSGMLLPASAAPLEAGCQGVTFDTRVQVSVASGAFTKLGGLTCGDIQFSAGEAEGGFEFVRVVIPQGPQAQWPSLFVPLDETQRVAVAGALDPTGQARDVGTTLKLEIALPAHVVGNGVTGKVRGTKASSEGSTASLIVPIQAALGASEPLVWHLTWQK